MKKLLKSILFTIIFAVLALVIMIYIPKPSRMFVKETKIEKIVYSCFTKRISGTIPEESYDELFKALNKSFIFTRAAKLKQASLDRIIIYYEDGSTAQICSTHVGWNKLSIYKNTFDFSICLDMIVDVGPFEPINLC